MIITSGGRNVKRLYYLLSDIEKLQRISERLHAKGIGDWRFHVLARDERGLIKHHLHSANFFMKRDLVHSGERGALIGAAVGLYLCAFVMPWSIAGPGTLAAILLAATLVCAWLGGLIGGLHENYKITRFHDQLEAGKYLVLIDVLREEETRVRELVRELCPELEVAGTDSPFSNPFKTTRSYFMGQHWRRRWLR